MPPAPRYVLAPLAAACLLVACGNEAPAAAPVRSQPAGALAASSDAPLRPSAVTWSGVRLSRPVRDLPIATGGRGMREIPRRPVPRAMGGAAPASPDLGGVAPLAPLGAPAPLAQVPVAGVSFEGIGDGFNGFRVDSLPADPTGDVGPNQYVQAVNVAFAVFDKTGHLLAGPIQLSQLWSQWAGSSSPLENLCATMDQGDPVVLYDRLANRWLLSQFAFATDSTGTPVAPYAQCVAVSQTGDPTASWYLYVFGPMTYGGSDAFNDYAKLGVWPDGYYATYNMFGGSALTFYGTNVCAMDRASMLTGSAATQICFELANVGGTLPATVAGLTPPPPGTPGLVLAFDTGSTPSSPAKLELWRAHVDFANPSAAKIDSPAILSAPRFTWACPSDQTGFDCVVQPGTTTKLDAIGDRLMQHLSYRNFGGVESLLASHVVDEDGSASTDQTAVRWYELRNASGATFASAAPVLYQSGNVPGGDRKFRWNESLAMDAAGDVAIGYSISGSATYPSLAASGRLVGDPPGTLGQTERVLFAGQGSQTTYKDLTGKTVPATRWGDFSAMTVDPADDCTFWYTNEYLPSTGAWHTRVVAFRYPTCTSGIAYRVAVGAATPPACAFPVDITAVDAWGAPIPGYAGQATVTTSDPLAIVTPQPATFSGGAAHVTITFGTPGARDVTARDVMNLSITGSASIVGSDAAALAVRAPASFPAGAAQTVTIAAVDACGTLVPSWTGAAALTATDPAGSVGTPSAFTGGVATATVALQTIGTQTITATTTTTPALSGSAAVTVVPGPVASLTVDGPATARAGDAVVFQLRAFDAYGNFATNASDTVFLTTTDGAATPTQAVVLQNGAGHGAVTFATPGMQTVTATSVSAASVQGTATLEITSAAKTGCGCGAGAAPGWAALLPLAFVLVPRRRRA